MNTGWWVADLLENGQAALLVSWIVWVIGSICLHELAHGWAAIRVGDDTPIAMGHMTWNPLVHMGGVSLIIFFVAGIAWGAMPVSPHRMRGRHAEAFVAFAGPATNIALALIAILLGGVWTAYGSGVGDPLYTNVVNFFYLGGMLNIVLAALNLLPAPPLDGSRILAHYSRGYRELLMSPQAQMVAFIVLIIVFFQLSEYIFAPARHISDRGIATIAGLLP